MNARLFCFVGGEVGPWRVVSQNTVVGEPLADTARLDVIHGLPGAATKGTTWILRGVTSNERYVTRAEKELLLAKQPSLGRPDATCAALILLRKTPAWWSLLQDERRVILEERSRHIAMGLQYLPAIARRLHHCRDLGAVEPFDFITWFEFSPADAPAFDELVAELRASAEWTYVDREVDLRLVR